MRKSRFTPEQILQALRQAEGGTVVGEIVRKLGVTEATFYRWKKQYAGLDVGELRELRALREENAKLRQAAFRSSATSRVRRCSRSATTRT